MKFSRVNAGAAICMSALLFSCTSEGDCPKTRTVSVQPDKGGDAKERGEKTTGSRDKPGLNDMEVTSASFSPNGKRFVVAFQQKSGLYTGPKWKMWDVQSGKEIKTSWPNYDFRKKYHNVYSISYLPDGKHIMTMEFPNTWRIWDSEKIEVLREFAPDGRPLFTAEREKYLMVAEKTGSLGLWEVKTGECVQQSVDIDKHLYPALLSPDARWAVFRGDGYESAYYDLKNKKRVHYVKNFFKKSDAEKQEGFLYPQVFSPDGKIVLASKMKGATTSGVALCDAATLKVIKEISDVSRLVVAAFTPDGEKLLIHDAGYPRRLRCWSVKSTELLWTIGNVLEPPEIQFVVPSPKGDLVLLVNRLLVGDHRNNRPRARMVLVSAKTGEIVSRMDADVFPSEDFPNPNSEK